MTSHLLLGCVYNREVLEPLGLSFMAPVADDDRSGGLVAPAEVAADAWYCCAKWF